MVLLIYLMDEREQLVHALTGLRGNEQHRCIRHVCQTLTDTQRVLLHGGAVLLDQIPLVYHDDARLACIMCLAGNLCVLLGNAFGRVNHDNAYIGALYR